MQDPPAGLLIVADEGLHPCYFESKVRRKSPGALNMLQMKGCTPAISSREAYPEIRSFCHSLQMKGCTPAISRGPLRCAPNPWPF